VLRQGKVVGNLSIPCLDQQLVDLMFGRELAMPVKPRTRRPEAVLKLEQVAVTTDRLDLKAGNLMCSAAK
jgi:simple sugar transport system ATP-binding protein